MQFSPESNKIIQSLLTHFPPERRESALIPVLHLAQRDFRAVTPEVEELVATTLQVPIVQVRECLSFYEMFSDKPVGKYHFQVCWNIACSLLGAEHLIDYLSRRLGIQSGEVTADGKFSLRGMECLGACSEAPTMLLNEELHTNLTKEKLDKMLKELGVNGTPYNPSVPSGTASPEAA